MRVALRSSIMAMLPFAARTYVAFGVSIIRLPMFRILSIDGGGVRGIYPAHILALMSQRLGVVPADVFDIIVGTSTGAIIGAAAALRMPLDRVTGLYETRAREIFSKRFLSFRGILRSKYRSDGLRNVLTDVFGQKTMGDVPGRLILPATDLSNGTVFVIKSPYLDSFVRDRTILVVDAVMASCAAPSYFDPVQVGPYLLADGGLWGNNPSFLAYTEAVGKLGVRADDVRILSLGTGTGHQFYDVGRKRLFWGLATGWGRTRLVDTFLNLQSRVSTNVSGLLLQNKYMRVTFEESGPLPLDDVSQVPRLKAKADEAFTYESHKIKAFLSL